MAALSIQVPYPVFYDRDGQPIDNGNIYIGVANLDPVTNPLQVYYDEALTITASQPLKTSNGYVYRNGTPTQLYVDAVNFSILVNDSKNLLVYSFQDGTGISPNTSGITYNNGETGGVDRVLTDKLNDFTNVSDFGAVGDGVTDDTASITAAIAAVLALGGGSVIFPAGDFRISSILTLPGKVSLVGQGAGRVAQPVQAAATTISWYGAASEMIRVGYQGAVVVNGGVEGIRLDGRVLATSGLAIKDFQNGVFEEIVITGTTVSALYMTNNPAYDPTGFCNFKGIQISLRGGSTNSAHGILIDGIGGGVAGVTLCSWENVRIEHANGDAVRVNERGDAMTWYNLYTFRAGVETGFGIRATASASGAIGQWSCYNALPNGGIQIDTPNTAVGWIFDTLNDIDIDATAQQLVYGNGRTDVSVATTTSTRQKGPSKIRGFRNSIIEDPMYFRRWDSANNTLITSG